MNDMEVVLGYVRKVRAPGAFSHGPHILRRRFQAIVHSYMPSLSDFNSCLFQTDSLSVRDTSKRSQNVRSGYRARTAFVFNQQVYPFSRDTFDIHDLSAQLNLDSFIAK